MATTEEVLELSDALKVAPFDIRRKAQLARGGPTDHAGECVLVNLGDMDVDKTIFKTVSGGLPRAVIRDRLSNIPYWSDHAAERINELYSAVPKSLPHDRPILEFMDKECNFSMEHADGSFMDHLQFVYDYSSCYYKEQSPRVLLLHSIMGVGTNYFPMEASKIPKLQALVNETEFKHIESFPSVLRLLNHGPLLDELEAKVNQLDKIKSISFHRVIDNAELTMNAEEFWIMLNYQQAGGDNFLHVFTKLYKVLSKTGKLVAKVDTSLTPLAPADPNAAFPKGRTTLGGIIRSCAPSYIQLGLAKRQMTGFSAAINHDLTYKLEFNA